MEKDKLVLECLTILKKIQNNCEFRHGDILVQTFVTNGHELESEIQKVVEKIEDGGYL